MIKSYTVLFMIGALTVGTLFGYSLSNMFDSTDQEIVGLAGKLGDSTTPVTNDVGDGSSYADYLKKQNEPKTEISHEDEGCESEKEASHEDEAEASHEDEKEASHEDEGCESKTEASHEDETESEESKDEHSGH